MPDINMSTPPDWNLIDATYLLSKPELLTLNKLRLETSDGVLYVEINTLGVRVYSEKQRNHDYGLLVTEPELFELTLDASDLSALLKSDHLVVKISYKPLSFDIEVADQCKLKSADDGHFVRKHRVPPLAKVSQGWLVSWALSSGEPVYGGGEKWGALNKRGQLLRSYNHDALGVNAEVSYKNTPFCWSPNGWGVFFHTPAAVTHAVGCPDWSQRSYCALLEDSYLDMYVLIVDRSKSPNEAQALLENYTQLTGRAPMPPVWSGGVILSKAYYKDADEIISVAEKVRNKKMPCDVITFDGRAWQDTDTRFAFEWCPKRYPEPNKY